MEAVRRCWMGKPVPSGCISTATPSCVELTPSCIEPCESDAIPFQQCKTTSVSRCVVLLDGIHTTYIPLQSINGTTRIIACTRNQYSQETTTPEVGQYGIGRHWLVANSIIKLHTYTNWRISPTAPATSTVAEQGQDDEQGNNNEEGDSNEKDEERKTLTMFHMLLLSQYYMMFLDTSLSDQRAALNDPPCRLRIETGSYVQCYSCCPGHGNW